MEPTSSNGGRCAYHRVHPNLEYLLVWQDHDGHYLTAREGSPATQERRPWCPVCGAVAPMAQKRLRENPERRWWETVSELIRRLTGRENDGRSNA